MTQGYMYILLCADNSYYTGSTKDLELRLKQHQAGEGANHKHKRLHNVFGIVAVAYIFRSIVAQW